MAGKSLSRAVRKDLLRAADGLKGPLCAGEQDREGRDSERVRSSVWLQRQIRKLPPARRQFFDLDQSGIGPDC